MSVNYLILIFTGLYLAGTFFYYKYAVKKGIEFRYKPNYFISSSYSVFSCLIWYYRWKAAYLGLLINMK